MQANMWQRFFVLILWEVFRPPQLSWTSGDLPICKYKIIIFILPFRLMVRMLQMATEPRGLCKPGIPFCLRVAEIPGVCPSQCCGCILQLFLCAGRAGSEAAAPVCVPAHPGMPIAHTVSAGNPALLLLCPTETPHPQSQVHRLSHVQEPPNIGVASESVEYSCPDLDPLTRPMGLL